MYKLHFQDIINPISFKNLPPMWQKFDFMTFSKDKTLFDFQKQGLQNALKGLWFYFKDKNADKDALFSHYKLNGLQESFDYYLNHERKAGKYLLEYPEDYPVVNNKISFACFINRMSFWMATGSGKTLVIVKLIEFLGKLMAEKELPTRDILFLTHRDDLLNQFKNHVDDFNRFNSDIRINLHSLKNYESVRREHAMSIARYDVSVFYYRSDLISDEQKEKIVDFKNYDNSGQWYILLDEAHKGDKEDSKRQILYSILSRNGFLFNFSATFTDPRDFATCVFNFNLSRFIKEGYGKHIYVSSGQASAFRTRDDFSLFEKQKIILKTLFLLTYLIKHLEAIRKVHMGLYHRPLLLTLVNSVDVRDSDLELFFRELEKVAANQIRPGIMDKTKQELVQEFSHRPEFEFEKVKCIVHTDLISKLDYKDILKYVFNAPTPGKIEVLKIPDNRQELILRLMTAEKPFSLIKIGDISGWLRDKLTGYEINESFDNESYFRKINRNDSDINILMGSRSFYEGWDSNRPNIVLFINIGIGTNAKKFVLQSVGRGIRIEPLKNLRRRLRLLLNSKSVSKSLFDRINNRIQPVESLFVFGTHAENLKEIIKILKEQKEYKNPVVGKPERLTYLQPVSLYNKSEKIFAQENETKKFPISHKDLSLASQLYEYLGDKVVLARFDCDVKVLKKVKESFMHKDLYYDYDNTHSLGEPELILKRIFNYFSISIR